MIREAIAYFEGQKKRLEDFRKIYPSPDTIGYQATTKEIIFYDMAISALSENNGDLISRQALLEKIYDYDVDCMECFDNANYFAKYYANMVEDMPSVDSGDFVRNIPNGTTNGEVIQALFPNVSKYNNMLLENHSRNILFNDDWWNSSYKAESEE